jgi:ketosteroid isomerase-like protein
MDRVQTLRRATFAIAQLMLGATPLMAQRRSAQDSADVVAVHTAFHRALGMGDSVAVLRLLAPDVQILESGGSQNREEYRTEHLAADIAFARAAPGNLISLRVTVLDDVAWITSTTSTTGEFQGRQINSLGAELMVIRRVTTANGRRWVIEAIHWSSRRKASGTG